MQHHESSDQSESSTTASVYSGIETVGHTLTTWNDPLTSTTTILISATYKILRSGAVNQPQGGDNRLHCTDV